MKEHYSELLRVFLNGGWGEAVCFSLINVKTGGAWDLKSSKEWDLKKNKKYLYHDIVLRFDEPGNIHYGYVGSAIFSLPVLLSGAGLYQILSNTSKICYISSYFDDPLDSAAIKYGYLLKHEIYSTVFYFDSLSTYEKYYKGLER